MDPEVRELRCRLGDRDKRFRSHGIRGGCVAVRSALGSAMLRGLGGLLGAGILE